MSNDSAFDGPVQFSNWTSTTAQYGTFTANADGTYQYVVDNNNASVNALNDNSSPLTETFSYQIKDSDGDITTAQVIITINGHTDAPPIINVNDNNGSAAGDRSISEDASATISGSFSINADAGLASITLDGTTITLAQLNDLSANPVTVATSDENGSLIINDYDANTGIVSYSYQVSGAKDHSNGDVIDNITLNVTDVLGLSSSDYLSVLTTDTAPQAIADARTVNENETNITGNVIDGTNATQDQLGVDITQLIGVSTGTTNSAITAGVNTAINGTYGTLTIDGNGNYNYVLTQAAQQLSAGDQPTDIFSYTLQDSDGDQSTTQLTFTVNGSDDAPLTNSTSQIGEMNTTVAINLTGEDIDGTVISFTLSSLPANGTLYTDTSLTTLVRLTDDSNAPIYYPATNQSLTFYFIPDNNWNGDTNFQYSARDNSGLIDQSPATASITINPEQSAYEAGLINGTLASDAAHNTSVSGVLFSGINSVTAIESINGISPVNGVLTVTTLQGNTLTVNADVNSANFGHYTYTLNNPVNHSIANGQDVFNETFSYQLSHNDNSITSANLTVKVIDDSPVIGEDQTVTIEIDTISSNLTFILDASGSMSDADMTASVDAVKALITQYQEFSDVNINIVIFRHPNSSRDTTTTGWISDYPENLDISRGGSTDIALGLNTVMGEVYGTNSGYQPATQDAIYYFGDGGENVNASNYTNTLTHWQSFLESGPVDALFTYSINNSNISYQESIARVTDGALNAQGDQGQVYRPLVHVEDFVDLTDAVLDDILTTTGGNLLIDDNADSLVDFGADGGHVDTITINGVSYAYDQDNPTQEFAGLDGIYSVNFDTGTYTYRVETNDSTRVDHSDQLQVVIVDRDGDKSTPLQLTFTIEFSLNELAQQVTTISDAATGNGGELIFDITMNGIAATAQTYNIDITNLQTTAADYAQFTFSDGVTLNNNGTITVPAGISSFTAHLAITDDNDQNIEALTLTIGGITATGTIDISQTWSEQRDLKNESFISGGADDTVEVIGNYDIEGTAVVETGAGNDTITVGKSIKGDAQVDTGAGNDSISLGGLISGDIKINTGSGNDSINIATHITNKAQIQMGTGDDTVNVGTSIGSKVKLDTGAGNDQLIAHEIRSHAIIKMGAGDDTLIIDRLNLTTSSTTAGEIDMGTGDDTLTIDGQFAKATKAINLGDGQDTLILSQMSSTDFDFGLGGSSIVTVANGIQSIHLTHLTATATNNVDLKITSAEKIIFGGDNTTYLYDWAAQKYLLTTGGTTSTATVIDGIIAGLEYTTSSGISGLTTAQGGFEFNAGDIVSFNIGKVELGDVDMAKINDSQVFLQDIAQINRQDMTDQYVENMAVLLQSLDDNNDAYDGIVITQGMHNAFSDTNFDLATISEQELAAIIFDQTGRQAIDENDAMTHVGDMLAEYADIKIDQSPASSNNAEIFKWLGETSSTTSPTTAYISDFDASQGDKLDLSDVLSVNNDGSLTLYLAINFDNGDTTLAIHAGDESSPIAQVMVLEDVDLSQYASDGSSLINGLLNHSDGPLIISSAADDRLIGLDDDLSNGFID